MSDEKFPPYDGPDGPDGLDGPDGPDGVAGPDGPTTEPSEERPVVEAPGAEEVPPSHLPGADDVRLTGRGAREHRVDIPAVRAPIPREETADQAHASPRWRPNLRANDATPVSMRCTNRWYERSAKISTKTASSE